MYLAYRFSNMFQGTAKNARTSFRLENDLQLPEDLLAQLLEEFLHLPDKAMGSKQAS